MPWSKISHVLGTAYELQTWYTDGVWWPVSLMIKKSTLRQFGHVERKEYNDWVMIVVWRGKSKELNREDTKKRPDGIVLRIIRKIYACPRRMCSSGINAEAELRGQPANTGSPGKKAVKTDDLDCQCTSEITVLSVLQVSTYMSPGMYVAVLDGW